MRRLAPCGLGGDRGAELRHGAPDFAPNRKDFKHQGRPEHLLWVHVNCQELLTDPLTDPKGTRSNAARSSGAPSVPLH